MHRSGTSLLGSLIQALGVTTPGPLIHADEHNPEGYVERRDVTGLQEQLLVDLDRWWPAAAGDQALPAEWLHHPATIRTRDALRTILVEEASRQRGPWAIKDPRTSLLLPLWRELSTQLDIPLRLLLAVRHPAEVTDSLCRRDSDLAGMTPERAQRLWWRHNLAVLSGGDGLPLTVIDYSRWFAGPKEASRQLLQLRLACGLPNAPHTADPESLAPALARIRPEHRRSQATAPLLPVVERLYQRLAQLSRHPGERRRHALLADLQEPRGRHPLQLPPASPVPLDAGPWFDPEHYVAQRPDLRDHPTLRSSAQLLWHYFEHGWRENSLLEPHPLFQPGHYRDHCRINGLECRVNPLRHFLELGAELGLAPNPLIDLDWMTSRGISLRAPAQALHLGLLHPWGAAAEALHPDQPAAARERLQHWQQEGLEPEELAQLTAINPWPVPPSPVLKPLTSAERSIRGADPHLWAWHVWRQHLGSDVNLINLAPLNIEGPARDELLALSRLQRVLDPDPDRVQQMIRLGIAADHLDVSANPSPVAPQDWLEDPTWLELASSELGLPPPACLAEPHALLVLGTGGEILDRQLQAPCFGLPGFDQLQVETHDQARALAAWLQTCQLQGIQLLRLNPTACERNLMAFEGLLRPHRSDPLPVQYFTDSLDPAAIDEELAWRRAGCPPPQTPQTPQPSSELLWQHDGGQQPEAAVVISLYNYADRIEAALLSAWAQTLEPLELVIVDDASSDDGARRVQQWLERKGDRFARVRFLKHPTNSGLAAARNSGFAATISPWCYVLDADNILEPTALRRSLMVANGCSSTTAVVYPLVDIRYNDATGERSAGLISRVSWQRQQFLAGNVVDAMALVRRSAWEAVGGYVHIPGGWEDFDFWCSLIDAGWHGVLCPERLAVYHRHSSSMLQQQTDRHVRRISRLLQARHPWLELPMAQPDR